MFRAGTSSRLKRPSLFRSCRWEASSKTQGLSEDASLHAREHKTPTEGTAHGIHRSAPENQRLRHTGFFALPLKVCCPSAKKVFGSTPFSKGVAGLQGGSPAKSIKTGFRAGSPARTLGCRAGSPAKRTGLKSKKDILEKRKRRGGEELLTVRRNPSVQSQED